MTKTDCYRSSFNNEKYSNVTVYLGESKTLFPAHRLILGMRSPYFDDALQSKIKEGITHEFRFEENSPHALWRVLQYMYTGDYADEPPDSLYSEGMFPLTISRRFEISRLRQAGDDLELLRHPRVYALADTFRMEDLKSLLHGKFKLQLQEYWISDTFVDCIREVYSISTDFGSFVIRDAVVEIASLHKKDLVQKRPFQELIREVGDFAVDLMLVIAKDKEFGF